MNGQPHRIHLKGPWQFEWLADESNDSPPVADRGRVKLPAEWRAIVGRRAGRARFRRRFGRPTNIQGKRVVIAFDGIGGTARVLLGGEVLGEIFQAEETARFDVTGLLQGRNELVVEIDFDPRRASTPGGLWGPVALEIHEPDER